MKRGSESTAPPGPATPQNCCIRTLGEAVPLKDLTIELPLAEVCRGVEVS